MSPGVWLVRKSRGKEQVRILRTRGPGVCRRGYGRIYGKETNRAEHSVILILILKLAGVKRGNSPSKAVFQQ